MGGFRANAAVGPPGPAGSFESVPSVNALRALVPADADAMVALNTYDPDNGTVADQSLFQADLSNAIDDGVTRFNVGGLGSIGPGWQRIYDNVINVRFAGAVGDGFINDTAAILRALNFLKSNGGGTLYFPEGTYLTDPINLQGPGGGNWANIQLKGDSKRSATSGGSIIKARAGTGGGAPATQTYVLRSAGQNITAEDITFSGNFATTEAVVFYDYQSFSSGLTRCFVTATYEPAAIIVAPNHTIDSFHAVAHGFSDGDQLYFTSTGSIPGELYQPYAGVNNWVWFVVNATADDFQVELAVGDGPFTFTDNGTGVVSVHEVGASLIRIGGVSGLQADTGYIHDCVLYQNPLDATKLAGRGIFISDNNAVLWDVNKTHIQSCVDCVYIRGGGASFRECTIFPYPSVSRSHFLKDGLTNQVVITDETATEIDACPFIVVIGNQSSNYAQAWVYENLLMNSAAASINWDCWQPLILSGTMGGDVWIRPDDGAEQVVTAIAPTYPMASFNDPTFHGEVTRLIRIGGQDRTGVVRNEMRHIAGPSSPSEFNTNGFGLFIDGGEPANPVVSKVGAVVLDVGEPVTENQTQSIILSYRVTTPVTVTVTFATDTFTTASPHGLNNYDSVQFDSTLALPDGILRNEHYWVLPTGATTFKLSRSRNGPVLDISNNGTGTISASILKGVYIQLFDVGNVTNFANTALIDTLGFPLKVRAAGKHIGIESSLFEVISNAGAGNIWLQGDWRGNFDTTRKTAWRIAGNTNQVFWSQNSEGPASNYERNGGAGYVNIDVSTGGSAGDWDWYTAPSGTAGNAITFTKRLTLKQNGDVVIPRLSVAGQVSNDASGVLSTRLLPVAAGMQQTADTSTSSGTFADMGALSVTLTTQATSKAAVKFSAVIQGTLNTGYAQFKILLDGSLITGTNRSVISVGVNGGTTSIAIDALLTGLSAGSHTIKVQWAVTAGTLSCNPAGSPGYFGADLIVQEVLV